MTNKWTFEVFRKRSPHIRCISSLNRSSALHRRKLELLLQNDHASLQITSSHPVPRIASDRPEGSSPVIQVKVLAPPFGSGPGRHPETIYFWGHRCVED